MTKPVAITGSLVDIKNVNMHKSARLTIDVPAEQAASIIASFGWPTMASPVPVAVARLIESEVMPSEQLSTAPTETRPRQAAIEQASPAGADKSPRPWSALSYATQAGIRSGEPLFAAFLREVVRTHLSPIEYIYVACGVTSRAAIRHGTFAGEQWAEIEKQFSAWKAAERVGAI